MRIGLVVDGRGEPAALRSLASRAVEARVQIVDAFFVNMSPRGAAGNIAAKIARYNGRFQHKRLDRLVVLLDREDLVETAAERANLLARVIERHVCVQSTVVVKDRTVENWLVADPDALASMPARFRVTEAFRRKVCPNRADGVREGARLLDSLVVGRAYHKGTDPQRIANQADPCRVADNSRSFRRFLAVLDVAAYLGGSCRPAR